MTKTGRRGENIVRRIWRKSGICGKMSDEICTFWRTKNGIFGSKILRRLCMMIAVRRSLSLMCVSVYVCMHVALYASMCVSVFVFCSSRRPVFRESYGYEEVSW